MIGIWFTYAYTSSDRLLVSGHSISWFIDKYSMAMAHAYAVTAGSDVADTLRQLQVVNMAQFR